MAVEVIMPKLGVDMQEGEILEWKKKVGDKVEEGDILLEIMSDKTNMELEAEASGYLIDIKKGNGEVVPVTQVIAYIGEKDEKVDSPAEEKQDAPAPKAEEKTAVESKPLSKDEYDIVVVGGGPAGYYAAIRGAQLGGKVALIEKDAVGGTCLNRGCIPTKTYLKNTEILEFIEMAEKRGIVLENQNIKIDMDKTVNFKNQVVSTLTNGIKGLLKSNNVDVFNGLGVVHNDKTVSIGDTTIKGKKIVLATGSKVGKIKLPGIESKLVLTSDDILDLRQIPKSLVVIGGGVVGIELGQVFHSYGSEVTVIEMFDRIVPAMDAEVSQTLRKVLEAKGMKIHTSTKLNEIVEKDGHLVLKLEGKEDLVVEKALLSIGRVPQLEGLEELDIEVDRGRIKVNDYMETSVEGIYAPGDVNGIKMLAHSAFRMGEIAAENAMQGNHRKVNFKANPSAVYTIPEVGIVGLTEEEAREKYDISVGKFYFAGSGRAIASGETDGFVKVIADKKYHEILGVHIIGPVAAEMINEAATLVEMEITVDEVAKTIHGHPTYSEAFYEACLDVLGEAIHLPKKANKKY